MITVCIIIGITITVTNIIVKWIPERFMIVLRKGEPMENLISRQAAIDALCRRCDLVSDDEPCTDECNDIKILKMLPSAQPEPSEITNEQASCVYCHEDSDGYVTPIEKNCHAFIRFGMEGWELSLKANGWHGSAKIKYCPMCGRELKK